MRFMALLRCVSRNISTRGISLIDERTELVLLLPIYLIWLLIKRLRETDECCDDIILTLILVDDDKWMMKFALI